jgi:hypothetical protein
MHPIVPYIAEEWDRADREERPPDLSALNISDVIEMCKSRAAKHPTWSSLLHFQTLPLLLKKQLETEKWWLVRKDGEDNTGEYIFHIFSSDPTLIRPFPCYPLRYWTPPFRQEEEGKGPRMGGCGLQCRHQILEHLSGITSGGLRSCRGC